MSTFPIRSITRSALLCLTACVFSGCDALGDVVSASVPVRGDALAFVKTNMDPEKTAVTAGEVVTLWIETPAVEPDARFSWDASAGSLSATTGARVRWTAGGRGRVRVSCTVSVGGDSRVVEYVFTVQ